ncbi:hypothetical protein UA08_06155 [Talaromyces atroroseus]|uniref:Extracellular protein n=1 Tax=Talaromyces atroroseus TaxID=1441469 RepID=A0A225AVJ5_TALAT|nr:hypothetical protein UA08_06155 [Talaromyces atroroseus]OKL58455.1 hypothetical protein UA08_06155 [Talaromyces atroroseus]
MKNTFVVSALLASAVSAHMQMSNPYPLRSPLNPNGDEGKKDYSYTNPLSSSGSDYPCKGYQDDPFVSVATYTAGSEYSMSLDGSATHGGGSCQLALSYDTGKTFTVIKSIEGGCPLTSNYTFTVPSDAPSGNALFSWTWFNKIGNREMYMNCAQVTIDGGASKRTHARDMKVSRADVGFSSRPPIFIANVDGPGGCTTTSSEEVNFPEPGPDVEGSVDGTGYTCSGSADFLGNGGSSSSSGTSSGSSSSSSSSTSTAASQVPHSSSSTKASASTTSSTSSKDSSKAVNATVAPKIVSTGATEDTQACSNNGAIVCGSDGNTWSMCSQGRLANMGSVASGTICENGAITRKV